MRAIVKGSEPRSLTAHRKTPPCDYDNYADKDVLRRALVTEQRGLCCYCMGRIRDDPKAMKIEHWHCRSHYQGEQLEYRNLLGACLGGEGQPPRFQHCDTRKGDQDLMWNPADPDHHIDTRVCYEVNGHIRSDEQAFNSQINEVLNLNLSLLRNARKRQRDAILDWWHILRKNGYVARYLAHVSSASVPDYIDGTGELQPFCQVAVWWLDQRLARMPK